MAYIPTIHTFEDDIKENSDINNTSTYNSVNNPPSSNNILIPDKKEKSLTKKILNFITVLLLIGSVSVLSYYFYTK